eukprot:m.242843 g.242843  ORF g.242843 m.242843 type:complete len:130 (+) comp26340_c0_seq1:813-1202(+)
MRALLLVSLAVAALSRPMMEKTTGNHCDICTPAISQYEIKAVPMMRAVVEIVPDWGTCLDSYRGYVCYVNWGDDSYAANTTQVLWPQQLVHTYTSPGLYNITAYYCAFKHHSCYSCSECSNIVYVESDN